MRPMIAFALTLFVIVGIADAQQTQQQVAQYDEPDELALREYIDIRVNSLELAMQAGLATAKEAVVKAEDATERRFESVNEFRGQLNDQQRSFMPRLEYEQAHNALISRVDELTKRVDDREARSGGMSSVWLVMVAFISVTATVVSTIVLVMTRRKAGGVV